MYCPNCGEKIEDGSRFCRYCGSKVVIQEDSVDESDTEPQVYYSKRTAEKSGGVTAGCLVSGLIIAAVLVIILAIVISTSASSSVPEPENIEVQELSEEDYKAACSAYTYDAIIRNPDTLRGEKAVLTGEVLQVLEDSQSGSSVSYYRLYLPKDGDTLFDKYLDPDSIIIEYRPAEGEGRILEEDKVTIWGELNGIGDFSLENGTEVQIPLMIAKYIKLEN